MVGKWREEWATEGREVETWTHRKGIVGLLYKTSTVAEMGDRLARIDIGQKLGACPFFVGGESWAPSNTMSPGPRNISIPNGILMHPAGWSQ